MTIRSLALRNIRGNWRSCCAFFLSSAFSVMVFYMFAAFRFHPDVLNGHILGADKVRQGMMFCQYIIIIFSVLFVLYSSTAFIRTRRQEFGLLTLFGMTRGQLRKLIVYEHAGIAMLAIGFGIGLGIAFSKLFFMTMEVLLDREVTILFAVPMEALGLTVVCFALLFAVISAWAACKTGHGEIVDMLGASREPAEQAAFSHGLAALAVICLGTAYGLALSINIRNFPLLALPVMISVTIGTYLFFTQFSLLVLHSIQRSPRFYYHRTTMIIVGQLRSRLKSNAMMLFLVSMLSAVMLTASGAIYMMKRAVQVDGYRTQYENAQSLMGLTMFIGLFISLLFFMAAGSVIYFKLFTELREDQAHCKALSRIGLTEGEIRGIVMAQIGILFFAPCIIGTIHALIAMKALDNLLMLSNWSYSFAVIGIYLVLHTIYFLITCHDYMNSILRGAFEHRMGRKL
ncbi:ABC transporter permease [Paenibacillus sp. S-12]|uniref:FtsX-like permease family protein n=1 Tax=Paenibacillus sp. S-12 TaxID=3031371 RepID=UPI0025A13434|nr:ABC transporter permease [Paenibacillus sp. S-12]